MGSLYNQRVVQCRYMEPIHFYGTILYLLILPILYGGMWRFCYLFYILCFSIKGITDFLGSFMHQNRAVKINQSIKILSITNNQIHTFIVIQRSDPNAFYRQYSQKRLNLLVKAIHGLVFPFWPEWLFFLVMWFSRYLIKNVAVN